MTGLFVVVLRDTHQVYGPFNDRAEADAFAEYLMIEVDPAIVVPLRSPARELLSWRDAVLAQGGGL